jgi:DNA (cytosine-5)-methyltransferase 1
LVSVVKSMRNLTAIQSLGDFPDAKRANRSTVVDLFAGCGGGSLGFRAAGFTPVAAVELDPVAAASYEANLGIKPVICDIRDVSGSEILSQTGLRSGDLTLLFGCPPCQSFTVLRRGQDPSDDDKRRNTLPREYLRLVEELQPRHLAFENVPGMVDGRGKSEFDLLLTGLAERHYQVVWDIVDAVDHGVPQRRRRLLVIASRIAVPRLPAATHGPAGNGLEPYMTVRQAIGDIVETDSSSDPLHRPRRHRDLALRRLKSLKEGQARADLPDELQLDCHREHKGHYDVYGRMWWDRPSPTLTSGCTNVTRGRFAHPEADRAITVREALILQGFPVETVLTGGVEAMALQIGNAIPPRLAQQIGDAVAAMERAAGPRAQCRIRSSWGQDHLPGSLRSV